MPYSGGSVFFFSYLHCDIGGYWQVVQVCKFGNKLFFLVDQLAMLVETSLRTSYKIKCKIGNERQPYVI